MYFWGLTIDLVSSIALVLAVGLCVDFAAHIAYAFMSSHGTRNERAVHAVSYIGGAVLHGGATTLLALSVLVFSHSYIFTAFFKVHGVKCDSIIIPISTANLSYLFVFFIYFPDIFTNNFGWTFLWSCISTCMLQYYWSKTIFMLQ